MSARPTAVEVHRAEKRLRTELAANGLLLAHDVVLPSATRCVAGESVRGSWWGHPSGRLIYETLQRVEVDIARVKLVARKSTLVYRTLWPALAALARCREGWQTAGLDGAALELLAHIERMGAVRTHDLEMTELRRITEVAKKLENRLLVFSKQEHTASGQHAKILVPFVTWQREVGLADADLPDVQSAREALTAPVRAWVGERISGLLPWYPAAARRSSQRAR